MLCILFYFPGGTCGADRCQEEERGGTEEKGRSGEFIIAGGGGGAFTQDKLNIPPLISSY